MLLVVDIGNTDIVFGVYDGQIWTHQWRHPSDNFIRSGAALKGFAREAGIDLRQLDRVALSSVVPGIKPHVEGLLFKLTGRKPLLIGPHLYEQLSIRIDNPSEIGSDLVANAVSAYHRTKGACIVVDFGTALTFTTVSENGDILGVAIAPGLKTAFRALFANTAQLPLVPLEVPQSAIGKNTAHALQAGILMGYVGLVREILRQIKSELGQKVRVLATGGLSSILEPLQADFDDIDPRLTMDGLRLLAERFS
ncbi:MAG: type III pantothenate kinase [Bacteroidota bacterium]